MPPRDLSGFEIEMPFSCSAIVCDPSCMERRLRIPTAFARRRHYVLTVALCLLSLPIARALDAPSSCFILVVMASSLYGGRGPALLATLFGGYAFILFFVPSAFHAVPSHASILRFGVFIGAMLLTMEIIETKRRSDHARLQLDEDFRSLAATSPDGIVSIDRTGVILFANPALTRMYGFSTRDVEGLPISLLLPSLAPGGEAKGEFAAVRKSGAPFDVEATCGGFGSKTTIFLRDISERIRTRRKLEESEENLRLTLETIPGLVYTQSPDGTIEYANGRVSEYFGRPSSDRPLGASSESIHPEDHDTVLSQVKQSFAIGLPYTIEYRSRRHDGVYRWVQTSVQPLKDTDGSIIRWYGLLTDVDDLKATQESLRRTQAQLAKAAQVATISELSASIVHEISQPISAMVANGQAALRWLVAAPPHFEDARTALERVVRDGKDAGKIVKGLRSLFRQSSAKTRPLDVPALVMEIASLIRDRAGRDGITVTLQIPQALPAILGDKIQLQQVLVNLTTNGMDSMQYVVDRRKVLVIRARQEGRFALFEIVDCGVGVADFDTVFDSFFTTKEKGLGMGLSICKTIIEAHGGRIWGAPSAPSGTVFSFTVPLSDGGMFAR